MAFSKEALRIRNILAKVPSLDIANVAGSSSLWTGPRLLVPVELDVMVIDKVTAAKPRANCAQNIGEVAEASGDNAQHTSLGQRKPFAEIRRTKEGAYLHWSLPDGLTKGSNEGEEPDETGFSASDQGQVGEDSLVQEETEFPFIPNRWVIARVSPGALPNGKREVSAWVVRSDAPEGEDPVSPLSGFNESGSSTNQKWLTAVGEGDPAWAAYYENVKNRLGFYDDLSGVRAGPVSYFVSGWYADKVDDPLYEARTWDEWYQLLEDRGWEYPARTESSQVYLDGYGTPNDKDGAAYDLDGNMIPLSTTDGYWLNPDTIAELEWADPFSEIDPTIPRQLLCHAALYNVKWNSKGGDFTPKKTVRDSKGRLPKAKAAIGASGIEALSALIANQDTSRKVSERLLNAQALGLLADVQQIDGLAKLESLLHAEDFESQPGGYIVDTVEEGDLIPEQGGSESRNKPFPGRKRKGTSNNFQGTKTAAGGHKERRPTAPKVMYGHTMADLKESMQGRDLTLAKNPRKIRAVKNPLPRYWEPKDPVILFNAVGRSFKHGEDITRSLGDALVCRNAGNVVKRVEIKIFDANGNFRKDHSVGPRDISDFELKNANMPAEIATLFDELLLLDEGNADVAAQSYARQRPAFSSNEGRELERLTDKDFASRYQVQIGISKNAYLDPNLAVDGLRNYAAWSGELIRTSPPYSIKPWRQPWTPIHFDWEVEWFPTKNRTKDWRLGEHDYDAKMDESVEGENPFTYSGTSLLTPAASKVTAGQIEKLLLAEHSGESDIASAQQEVQLAAAQEALAKLDVLSGSLSGLHDALQAKVDDYQLHATEQDAPNIDEQEASKRDLTDLPKFDVRAGHIRIKKLRIVDSFGQFVDLPASVTSKIIRAEDIDSPVDGLVRMPPRINSPSRLMFRMVQAADDNRDASKLHSPVCGWIMPDHLDQALEVFDANGNNLGQVQRQRGEPGNIQANSLEWQGTPGDDASFGQLPQFGNQHLHGMINGLLAQGEQDAIAHQQALPEKEQRQENALAAMLRMIDSTLWTVDPLGREGGEHLSVLLGRPLAIVRATLRLEVKDLQAGSELSRTPFDVRLGDVKRLGDGLIGYFVNDDYSQFYPVHEAIAEQTRATRPHSGYLGVASSVAGYHANFGSTKEPVEHPYINKSPYLKVRPVAPALENPASKSVMLTLVLDPRGGVHATSGILPRKKIELMREQISDALANMAVTFSVGPVLSNPETVRMPIPAEISGNWNWVRKSNLTLWEETPVQTVGQEPRLNPVPAQIHEGWLKLSNFQGSEED